MADGMLEARAWAETRSILHQLDEERDRQRDVHGWTAEHDDSHTRTDWSWILGTRLAEALDPATDDARFRRLLVETAAITVAALEAHDRRGGRTLR